MKNGNSNGATKETTMKTANEIKIRTTKRASGYTASYRLPWGANVREIGHATREDAIAAAKQTIADRLSR